MMQDWKEDSMSHVDEGTLHAYLDGELHSVERAALEAHLAGCATCRENLTEERALRERATAVLGSARPAERPAPPLEQLRREPKRSPWRVRRSFAWAASIAVALGFGYYMRSPVAYREAPAPDTPAPPVLVAQNHAASTREEKAAAPAAAPAPATALGRSRLSDKRAARPADEFADITPKDSAPARVAVRNSAPPGAEVPSASTAAAPRPAADTIRLDASVVSRAERDRAPAAAASIVVDGVQARQLTSTTWPVINRRIARSILGEEPVGLPGLATRAFRRAPGTDGTVVVEQVLDSSTVIQIFQRPAGSAYLYDSSGSGYANEGRARPRGYASEDQARERGNRLFARFVKGLRVEITGPLSADSLNRLLEQVAPLP